MGIQSLIKPMIQSFITNCKQKYENLSDLQKVERKVISILIRSYSSAPSPTSLSNEAPRSLGQIILDSNRLEIAKASIAIQSNIKSSDKLINRTFNSSISFKTDDKIVDDSYAVSELSATL